MAAPKTKRQLKSYLDEKSEPEPATIRAPERVWDRVGLLAEKLGTSRNAAVVASIEKACDEEGIPS